jgi:hypothetical protein
MIGRSFYKEHNMNNFKLQIEPSIACSETANTGAASLKQNGGLSPAALP